MKITAYALKEICTSAILSYKLDKDTLFYAEHVLNWIKTNESNWDIGCEDINIQNTYTKDNVDKFEETL